LLLLLHEWQEGTLRDSLVSVEHLDILLMLFGFTLEPGQLKVSKKGYLLGVDEFAFSGEV
jgi:hypothetical protein